MKKIIIKKANVSIALLSMLGLGFAYNLPNNSMASGFNNSSNNTAEGEDSKDSHKTNSEDTPKDINMSNLNDKEREIMKNKEKREKFIEEIKKARPHQGWGVVSNEMMRYAAKLNPQIAHCPPCVDDAMKKVK